MELNFARRLGSQDEQLDINISGMEIVDLGSEQYLVTSSGAGGGMRSYRVDPSTGSLAEVDQHVFASDHSLSDLSGISVTEVDGEHYVIAGSSGGNLIAFGISADGSLSSPITFGGTASATTNISASASIDLGGTTALYLADAGTGQLNAYTSVGGTSFSSAGGSVSVEGDARLQTAVAGDQPYVLLLDQSSRGVQSFQIDPDSGSLTMVDSLGSAQGIGIQSPEALQTATAFGETWVFAGSADSSAITVMRLNDDGTLDPSDHIVDTLETRFGDLNDIAIAQSGDRVFIVAGGGDDGLSLFTLLSSGQLLHLQSVTHETGLGLTDVREISATLNGDQIEVFASGEDGGITQFTLAVSDIGELLMASETGVDTLTGGGGDDVLVSQGEETRMTGGAGQDRFVVGFGAQDTTITDFNAANDFLDLSDFPMLRAPEQLSVETISGGIRLTYRDASITVFSHNGAGLTLDDLFGSSFWWPDRYPITLPDGLYLEGGAGSDSLSGASRADTLIGADGRDTLTGLDGSDQIRGEADSDLIFGNEGNDHLDGGDGDDTAWGGDGNDTVMGGDGDDTLGGSLGDDLLIGDAGNDEIWANQGQDSLHGGDGHDIVGGGSEDDILHGDAGNDQAWGGGGQDLIYGGLGHDTLGGREGNDTLDGGAGNDEIWANAGNDVLWGGTNDDTLGGSDGNDTLNGEEGADDLRAGNGDDSLIGGSGNDVMDGSSGNDRALGGEGDDLIYGGFGDDFLEGNEGNDRVWGGLGNDTAYGGEGDDLMGGADGNDLIYGETGNDEIWANQGQDTIYGGAGADTLGGGEQNDTLYGGDGTDQAWGGAGDDMVFGGDGNDTLGGREGDDTLDGGIGNDQIWANEGNDLVRGGSGHDLIGGSLGADSLYGESGNDTLLGSNGQDEIWAGTGVDEITGGSDADTFHFHANEDSTHITDFEDHDRIHIHETTLDYDQLDISQSGNDVLISFQGTEITLNDANTAAIDADHFIFG